MEQYIGMAAAFILLPLEIIFYPKLFHKKAQLGPILALTGLIMALIGRLPPAAVGSAFVRVFTTFSSFQTLIVVAEIGMLSGIMKQYGILDKVVTALEGLLPSKKALVMLLPAVMGTLSVPGGAFLSAPFVDSLGSDLKMDGANKAAVNLYFRHFAMFVLPYNTTFLAVSSVLPGFNIYLVIGLNLSFIVLLLTTAYFLYVRPYPNVKSTVRADKMTSIRNVLIYLSPVYMALVFNAVFGLKMYLSIFLCIVITFFLIGKDKSAYLKTAVGGLNLNTVFMLIGVYFMQNIIKSLNAVMSGVGELLTGQSVLGFLIIVPLAAVAFGSTTGLSLVPQSILLPFVAGMAAPPMTTAVYVFYILVWSFFSYFYSPFHMCQLLTLQYMGCSTGDMYKKHLRSLPILVPGAVLIFLCYYLIFV